MSNTSTLGTPRTATLPDAAIAYREHPGARAVVFVHGLLANGDLWRDVAPAVAAAGHRTLVPDWPFGSHSTPVPDADLSPAGVADLMAAFLAELDLTDVVLVANDTGGAMTQLLMARHPERIAGVVLTSADAYERFPPPLLRPLPRLVRVRPLLRLLVATLGWRRLWRLPLTYGWVAKRPFAAEVGDSFVTPARRDPGVRADLARFVRDMHPRHTLAAAEALRTFDRPVLLAWSTEDKHFPPSLGRRLAADLPRAEFVEIADAYTFSPLDRPDEVTAHVLRFLAGFDD